MKFKSNMIRNGSWLVGLSIVMLGFAGMQAMAGEPSAADGDVPEGIYLQSDALPPALIQVSQREYLKMLQLGKKLWHDRTLGNNGLNCVMCHPNGAVTHSETYPKYKSQFGKVVSEQEFINWCIIVPLQGQSHELGSEVLTAMEVYQNYENRGQVIEAGTP